MKSIYLLPLFVGILIMFSCGEGEKEPVEKKVEKKVEEVVEPLEEIVEEEVEEEAAPVFTNTGIGPIKELIFPETIDDVLAEKGKALYTEKECTSCHNPTQVVIGPAPKGIFERRNPAWVMNMIMNPEQMQKEDPDAMALLAEYNNVAMTNQDVSEEDARALLEYFRTL